MGATFRMGLHAPRCRSVPFSKRVESTQTVTRSGLPDTHASRGSHPSLLSFGPKDLYWIDTGREARRKKDGEWPQ